MFFRDRKESGKLFCKVYHRIFHRGEWLKAGCNNVFSFNLEDKIFLPN